MSCPTFPIAGIVGASGGFALLECQVPQGWNGVRVQIPYYSLSIPHLHIRDLTNFCIACADILYIIGARSYIIKFGVCQMADPSGEIVWQNPALIPTPDPQWGRWGMTLIGALLLLL